MNKVILHERSIAFALSALFLILFGLILSFDLDKAFSLDWDEGVYLCSAQMALRGHPVFTSVFYGQSPFSLDALTIAFQLFDESVDVGRGTILAFSLGALSAVGCIAWRVSGPLGSPCAMMLLGLSMIFWCQATVIEADMISLTYPLIAIALILSFNERPRHVVVIGAGFLFSLGCLSKLLVVPMLIPIIVLLGFGISRQRPGSGLMRNKSFRRQFAFRIALFCLGGIVSVMIAIVRFDSLAMYSQVIGSRFMARQVYGANWYGNLKIISNLLFDDPVLLAAAVSGVFWLFWRKSRIALWLVSWIAVGLLFLVDHRPFFNRHILLLLPPLAVTASANVRWIIPLLKNDCNMVTTFVVIALLFICLGLMFERDLRVRSGKGKMSGVEREVIRLIHANSHNGDYIISDQQMHVFLSGRLVPPELCDTSFNRIKSGYLKDNEAIEASKKARMIVFSTGRLVQLGRYVKWVEANYRLIGSFESDKVRVFMAKES